MSISTDMKSPLRLLVYIHRERTVLDLCCGSGYGSEIISQRVAVLFRYIGVDYSMEALAYGRGNYPGSFVALDAHKLPFKDSTMDFIVFLEGIEHVLEPETVLRETYRVLKGGGVLIISTINGSYFPRKAMNHILGLLGKQGHKYVTSSHLREYSFREFYDLLRNQKGFELVNLTGENLVPSLVGDLLLYLTPKDLWSYVM